MIMRTNHVDPYHASKARKENKTDLTQRKYAVGSVVEGQDAKVLSELGVAVTEEQFKTLIARKKISDPNVIKTVASK